MDPDKALQELREKMAKMQKLIDFGELNMLEDSEFLDAANRAIDLLTGLDRWMSMQGALPRDWAKGR